MYELIPIVCITLARGIAGWLTNALEDSKITLLEWKKLCVTILTLGIPSVLLFYGMGVPIEIASTAPVLVDCVFSFVRKQMNKLK